MSLVLFDTPGPRARRRVALWSVVAGVVILALLVVAAVRLNQRGIFDSNRWDIFYEDGETWEALLRRGLGATLRAAGVAAVIALTAGALVAVARMSPSASSAPWISSRSGHRARPLRAAWRSRALFAPSGTP